MPEAAIETEGLTKHFGDVKAVDDLDLRVEVGEVFAYLGPNGAGKSTTSRLLLDFLRPTRGTCRVLGGSGADPAIRERVGYLPDDLALPKRMTGNEAFRYFGSLRGGVDSRVVDDLIQQFQLDPTRPHHQLSTGNRRKVGIVLAFMHEPELLILDEPTTGLDPLLQDEFRKLVATRREQGVTIFLTSHVMAEVEQVAHRVGLIRDGTFARMIDIDELHERSAQEIRLDFDHTPDPAPFETMAGVADVVVDGSALRFRLTGRAEEILTEGGRQRATRITTREQDLDDLFMELYRDGS